MTSTLPHSHGILYHLENRDGIKLSRGKLVNPDLRNEIVSKTYFLKKGNPFGKLKLKRRSSLIKCDATPSNVQGRGERLTESSISSANSQNGNGSRMVPVEEALSRVRGNRNSINGKELNSTSLVLKNGSSTVNGSGSYNVKKETSNVSNGSSNFANGQTKHSGTVRISKKNIFAETILLNTGDLPILPSDDSFRWAQDDYDKTRRNIDVWSFVLVLRTRIYLLDAKWSYIGGFSEEKKKKRTRSLASWVRESILQLGPTFIKLGQLSSARSDFLPSEFVEELSKLQDRVPAFSAEKSRAMIEKELGAPINQLFAEFEDRPIAAASLGQVHRARLFNGESVVVKVQRPGLKELFDIDLDNMKIIATYFQNNEALGGPTRDWVGIYEECSTILYQEIDYLNEGRNADRFRRDFRKYPWVKVPKVYWDYASRKILTLEYLPGIKINNVAQLDSLGLDRKIIARHAIEAYLIQILRTGFFHADPHPGNLAVDSDDSLIYYDFGMMGEIKAFTKDRLLDMFYAVYEKDAKKVIASLIDLGALVPTGDTNSIRRPIQFFLDNLTGPKVDEKNTISAIGEDLFSIAIDQPFRFPATFTFVLRAFTTLEGVGKTLDTNFSFPEIAAPYAQELLDTRDAKRGQDFLVQRLQQQATEARDATVAMPGRVERMDSIINQLESGDLKLRVRVLEAERAARRSGILQVATMNAVGAAALLDIGVTLGIHGSTVPATISFAVSGIFAVVVLLSLRRVKRLDKFEKML